MLFTDSTAALAIRVIRAVREQSFALNYYSTRTLGGFTKS
jgi:hypothetical protein